jgi:hypothetical protein
MFQTKVVENIKTHILCSRTFSKNPAVYEIMWKNIVMTDRPQVAISYGAENIVMTDRPQVAISYGAENTRFACRVTKARIQTYTQNM